MMQRTIFNHEFVAYNKEMSLKPDFKSFLRRVTALLILVGQLAWGSTSVTIGDKEYNQGKFVGQGSFSQVYLLTPNSSEEAKYVLKIPMATEITKMLRPNEPFHSISKWVELNPDPPTTVQIMDALKNHGFLVPETKIEKEGRVVQEYIDGKAYDYYDMNDKLSEEMEQKHQALMKRLDALPFEFTDLGIVGQRTNIVWSKSRKDWVIIDPGAPKLREGRQWSSEFQDFRTIAENNEIKKVSLKRQHPDYWFSESEKEIPTSVRIEHLAASGLITEQDKKLLASKLMVKKPSPQFLLQLAMLEKVDEMRSPGKETVLLPDEVNRFMTDWRSHGLSRSQDRLRTAFRALVGEEHFASWEVATGLRKPAQDSSVRRDSSGFLSADGEELRSGSGLKFERFHTVTKGIFLTPQQRQFLESSRAKSGVGRSEKREGSGRL